MNIDTIIFSMEASGDGGPYPNGHELFLFTLLLIVSLDKEFGGKLNSISISLIIFTKEPLVNVSPLLLASFLIAEYCKVASFKASFFLNFKSCVFSLVVPVGRPMFLSDDEVEDFFWCNTWLIM